MVWVILDQGGICTKIPVKRNAVMVVGVFANAEELEGKRTILSPEHDLDDVHVIDTGPVERKLMSLKRFVLYGFLFSGMKDMRNCTPFTLICFVPGLSSISSNCAEGTSSLSAGQMSDSAASFLRSSCFFTSAARSVSKSSVTSHSPLRAFSVRSSRPGTS